jgi:hypothetical protein
MKRLALLSFTHLLAVGFGFAVGIYLLPILIEPDTPSTSQVQALAGQALYHATFSRDRKDSDALHWGEGEVSVGPRTISLRGRIAPGPDYKLYLLKEYVETEHDFLRLKPSAVRVGDVRTFDNFVVAVPESVNVSDYTTVVVWCETFSQFITSAKYR